MKKKVFALIIVVSVFLGGTAGAAGSYYADMIFNYNEQKRETLKHDYQEQFKETDKLIYNDGIFIVNQAIKEIDQETEAHLKKRLDEHHQNRLNEIQHEVDVAKNQAIKGLKEYIDELVGNPS